MADHQHQQVMATPDYLMEKEHPIHVACREGDVALVQRLLDSVHVAHSHTADDDDDTDTTTLVPQPSNLPFDTGPIHTLARSFIHSFMRSVGRSFIRSVSIESHPHREGNHDPDRDGRVANGLDGAQTSHAISGSVCLWTI